MERQGRILIVEDLPKWREALTEDLRAAGFYVQTAGSIQEARRHLSDTFYHLLIQDIRMVDLDSSNIEGWEFLQELDRAGILRGATRVMVITEYEQKREREAFRDLEVADFLSKVSFDHEEFLKDVQRIFKRKIEINLPLNVTWQGGLRNAAEAVVDLEAGSITTNKDTGQLHVSDAFRIGGNNIPLQNRLADELDDLLCRLFSKCSGVIVEPLTRGRSGASVLWVQREKPRGAPDPVVLKFGDFRKVDEENHNFEEYVQELMGSGRHTSRLDTRRTALLGGVTYSLVGSEGERWEQFGDYYQRSNPSQIGRILKDLFLETCKPWQREIKYARLDITNDYEAVLGFTKIKIENSISNHLPWVRSGNALVFPSLGENRHFTDPIPVLDLPHQHGMTYTCIAHGDLNEQNVLIDTAGHTWLIDFQRTGPGHAFRDITALDATIRLQMVNEGISLEDRLKMEEVLNRATSFTSLARLPRTLDTGKPDLEKAYATILNLRKLAPMLLPNAATDDIAIYNLALLYQALNTVRHRSLRPVQREHALLAASLLTDKLNLLTH